MSTQLVQSTDDYYAALAAEAEAARWQPRDVSDLAMDMVDQLDKWIYDHRVLVVGDHDYDADFWIEFDYARPTPQGVRVTDTLPVGLMLSRPGDHAVVPITWTFGTMTFGDTRLGKGRVIILSAYDGLEYLTDYVCSLTRPFFAADRKL